MSTSKKSKQPKKAASKNSVKNRVIARMQKGIKKAKKNLVVVDDGEKPKRNTSGLIPFQPGQSGNPNGRPKGKLNFDTRIEMAIDVLAMKYVEQYNKKHKKNKIKLEDVDIEGDIFLQYLQKARAGDPKFLPDFMDRRFGKAKQPVEMHNPPDDPMVLARQKEVDAEIEAWERQWAKKSGNKNNGNRTADKTTESEDTDG